MYKEDCGLSESNACLVGSMFYYFNVPAGVVGLWLIRLYEHSFMIGIMVLMSVFLPLSWIVLARHGLTCRKYLRNVKAETVWTYFPIVLLFALAVHSATVTVVVDNHLVSKTLEKVVEKRGLTEDRIAFLMGFLGEIDVPTIKVVGNQWFWSYEYPMIGSPDSFQYSSYMVQPEMKPYLRNLEVDSRAVLPTGKPFRILTNSNDVIHSFAVPRLFIKLDCIPGRTGFLPCQISRSGVYYGQCSEICGELHAFMPIGVEAVPKFKFYEWCAVNSHLFYK